MTTRWSIVSAAGEDSPQAAAALETLCKAYWYPVYAYVRRKGLSAPDAQDITQEFFRCLIEKKQLGSINRRLGSFRSFLLASMNHLLANQWDKTRTLKRGGGYRIISLELEVAEGRFVAEGPTHESPERLYDRRWALTLLDRALVKLREEFAASRKLEQFELLKVYLSDIAETGDYQSVAQKLGWQVGAVPVAVHRLRSRYREIVRAEIAETVGNDAEVGAEMRHLLGSLG